MKERQPKFPVYNFISYYLSQYKEAKKILEIGCGSMQYRPFIKAKYHGLDSPSSKYITDKKVHYKGFLEDTCLPNDTYDLAFGVAVFYYMRDPSLSFRKLYHTLKPGGKLVIFDYQKATLKKLKESGDQVKNLWTFPDIKKHLYSAGFHHMNDISFIACDEHFLIKNISEMTLLKLTNFYLRYIFSMLAKKQWLIVEATK